MQIRGTLHINEFAVGLLILSEVRVLQTDFPAYAGAVLLASAIVMGLLVVAWVRYRKLGVDRDSARQDDPRSLLSNRVCLFCCLMTAGTNLTRVGGVLVVPGAILATSALVATTWFALKMFQATPEIRGPRAE